MYMFEALKPFIQKTYPFEDQAALISRGWRVGISNTRGQCCPQQRRLPTEAWAQLLRFLHVTATLPWSTDLPPSPFLPSKLEQQHPVTKGAEERNRKGNPHYQAFIYPRGQICWTVFRHLVTHSSCPLVLEPPQPHPRAQHRSTVFLSPGSTVSF